MFQTKSKKFDMSKQRIASEEQAAIYKDVKIKDNKFNGLDSKKFSNATDWREESRK